MKIEFMGGPLDGETRSYIMHLWPPARIMVRREADDGRVVVHVYRYAGGKTLSVIAYEFERSEEG